MDGFINDAVSICRLSAFMLESMQFNTKSIPPSETVSRSVMSKTLVHLTSYILETFWPTECLKSYMKNTTTLEDTSVFVEQILRESHGSLSILLTALIYLIKLKIAQEERRAHHQLHRVTLCGRRMFLCALISAHKFLQDKSYSSIAWSRLKTCSALSAMEISKMEIEFLNLLEHKLFVSPRLFEAWNFLAQRLANHNVQQQQSMQAPASVPSSVSQMKYMYNHQMDSTTLMAQTNTGAPSLLKTYLHQQQPVQQQLLTPTYEYAPQLHSLPNTSVISTASMNAMTANRSQAQHHHAQIALPTQFMMTQPSLSIGVPAIGTQLQQTMEADYPSPMSDTPRLSQSSYNVGHCSVSVASSSLAAAVTNIHMDRMSAEMLQNR